MFCVLKFNESHRLHSPHSVRRENHVTFIPGGLDREVADEIFPIVVIYSPVVCTSMLTTHIPNPSSILPIRL